MSRVAALLAKDVRGITRDRFLLFLLLYAALFPLLLRVVLPHLAIPHLQLYLAPAPPIFGALLAGTVLGFSLIEERESGTLQLMRVLPQGEATQAFYLVGATTAISGLTAGVCSLLYGMPVQRPLLHGALLVATAAGGPLLMLCLGVFAENKIEGLALSKIASLPSAVPILLFVVPGAWQGLLAWSPWYWIYLGMLRAYAGDAELAETGLAFPALPEAAFWLVPLVLCAGCGALLARRLQRLVA